MSCLRYSVSPCVERAITPNPRTAAPEVVPAPAHLSRQQRRDLAHLEPEKAKRTAA
jgi:hypothetical protein